MKSALSLLLLLLTLLPFGAAAHSISGGADMHDSLTAPEHDRHAAGAASGIAPDAASAVPEAGGCAHCSPCCASPAPPLASRRLPAPLGSEPAPPAIADGVASTSAESPFKPPRA